MATRTAAEDNDLNCAGPTTKDAGCLLAHTTHLEADLGATEPQHQEMMQLATLQAQNAQPCLSSGQQSPGAINCNAIPSCSDVASGEKSPNTGEVGTQSIQDVKDTNNVATQGEFDNETSDTDGESSSVPEDHLDNTWDDDGDEDTEHGTWKGGCPNLLWAYHWTSEDEEQWQTDPTRDYYKALGLPRNSARITISRIRACYHKLAPKLHPQNAYLSWRRASNFGDCAEQESAMAAYETAVRHFWLVSEAYLVLKDPERRRIYDECGLAGLRQSEKCYEESVLDKDAFEVYDSFFNGDDPDDRDFLLMNGRPEDDDEDSARESGDIEEENEFASCNVSSQKQATGGKTVAQVIPPNTQDALKKLTPDIASQVEECQGPVMEPKWSALLDETFANIPMAAQVASCTSTDDLQDEEDDGPPETLPNVGVIDMSSESNAARVCNSPVDKLDLQHAMPDPAVHAVVASAEATKECTSAVENVVVPSTMPKISSDIEGGREQQSAAEEQGRLFSEVCKRSTDDSSRKRVQTSLRRHLWRGAQLSRGVVRRLKGVPSSTPKRLRARA